MAYRHDADLEFLGKCNNEELEDLFELLVRDPKDGERRLTEELTSSEEMERYGRDFSKYWQRIAEELQRFGGNTALNLLRGGKGVLYREIAEDVAKHLKAEFSSYDTTEELENRIVIKLLEDIYGNLTKEEKEQLYTTIYDEVIGEDKLSSVNKTMAIGFLAKEVFKRGGFASYKLTMITVNYVWKLLFKKGLSLATNAAITRAIGMALPVVNVIFNAWLIADITSPAMRVTVPSVLLISAMRKKKENENK